MLLLGFWFLNGKEIDCTFLVCWKSRKMQKLPFRMNFNISKYQRYLVCSLHFNFQKHHLYFALNFFKFLLLILRFFNTKYIHCTFLACWQGPIIELLPFSKHFKIEKRLLSFVCWFLCSKYFFSAVSCCFQLKMYERHIYFCNLHSKNTKGTLFLSL